MADLSALLSDPELMQRLSEMGLFDDQQNMLGQQMKRADALRGTPSAQGREVGQHNVYVASSPLEHLNVAFQRGMGEYGARKATQDQQALMDRMRANAVAMAQALRRGQPQPPQAQPPASPQLPGLDPRYT